MKNNSNITTVLPPAIQRYLVENYLERRLTVPIKRIVIDVLIPHDLDVLDLAEKIAGLEKVDGVNVHVMEIDEKTKTVEVTIEGKSLSFKTIKKLIEELGGSVHSIDMVSAGSRVVESKVTKQEEE